MIIDVETYPFAPGNMLPRIVCVQWDDESGNIGILKRDDARSFMHTLLDSSARIVGHNIPFDLGCVMTTWPELTAKVIAAYDADRVLDTMIWDMLRHIGLGLEINKRPKGYWSLAGCCKRFSVPHADKESYWRLNYCELDDVPISDWPVEALEYALTDPASTRALAHRLPRIDDVSAQTRWAQWLTLSSAYGVLTDQPGVARWAADKSAQKAKLEIALVEAGLVRADGTKDINAIRGRVLDSYGDNAPRTKPSKSHPKGQVKTSAEVCRDSKDSVLGSLGEYLSVCASLDREWPILQSPIVHTRYGLAATGRSTSITPNLQNMTKASGSRLCFMPRPGNVFVIIDYGGLELGTLGQLCSVMGCGTKLADAIKQGIDPHRMMAAAILGYSYEEVPTHPDYKKVRQLSKAANFGYPGGLGAASFIAYAHGKYGVDITLPEAKRLKRQWSKQWPEVLTYQKTVDRWLDGTCLQCNVPVANATQCPQCSSLVHCGILRQYRSNRRRGGLTFTQGCNTLFQGLGGDVTKDAGWRLTKAGYSIVIFIHDEYVIEVPREHAIDAAKHIQSICEGVTLDWLPDAPSRAEPVLATRWTKADPLYDDRGNLQIIECG